MIDPHETAAVASRIDHTVLKAEATWAQIDRAIAEAKEHRFASVCVNPLFIAHVKAQLEGSGVKACTVAGFPLGANMAAMKAGEAAMAARRGADEIDMVAHLPYLLEGEVVRARAEIQEVVYAVREARPDAVIKVIVESAVLMHEAPSEVAERRIAAACQAVREAGADFIKTSTGFHPLGGATVEAVRLMRKHASGIKVKAAGGIRTRADALAMIEAGADRLGCSASVAIVTGGSASAAY